MIFRQRTRAFAAVTAWWLVYTVGKWFLNTRSETNDEVRFVSRGQISSPAKPRCAAVDGMVEASIVCAVFVSNFGNDRMLCVPSSPSSIVDLSLDLLSPTILSSLLSS